MNMSVAAELPAMEPQSDVGAIVVRQYGLLNPEDWGPDCQEQLFLMNKLWNRLVEIERENRQKYFAIVGADPLVGELQTKLSGLLAERTKLVEERNARRAAARRRAIDTRDLDERIDGIGYHIRELSVLTKAARKEARGKFTEQLDALEQERRSLVKKARQESGLWWGNYNAVCDDYNTARSRALKENAELRFHAFDGTGRFFCQIQGGMSVEDLFAGRHSIVQALPVPPEAYVHPSRSERERLARTKLTITVYTATGEDDRRIRRTLTFPMMLHRPMPPEARIKELEVVRKRVGSDFRWSVTFTCRMPSGTAAPVNSSTMACGIDLGWRKTKDGLRVATLRDSAGNTRYIHMLSEKSNEFLEKMKHLDDLRSRIDTEFTELQDGLRERLKEPEAAPEALRELLRSILASRKAKHGKLFLLVREWRDNHSEFEPATLDYLDGCRKRLKRDQNEMDHLREKVLASRTDFYRCRAAEIAQQYAIIGLEKFDLRKIAKVKTAVGNNPQAPEEVRRMRQIANVSELRKWILLQAEKHGSEVRYCDPKNTTRTCRHCGHVNQECDPYDIWWTCNGCGKVWDQDENAADNILAAVTASA